jgi:hypothetical protein
MTLWGSTRVLHSAEPDSACGGRPGSADPQRLRFGLATTSDVDLTTARPVPGQPGTNRSLEASPPRLRWLQVNTINRRISPRWASSSATRMNRPAAGAIRRRVYPVMGHSRRSQQRRQARPGPVQRWHLARHAPVQPKAAARYQRDHGNRFGEFGLCSSHRVRCWPGEPCDYQRSSRNSNRHEWTDSACNHNGSARPSGCALDHADRHHLLNGLSAVARWKHGFIWG